LGLPTAAAEIAMKSLWIATAAALVAGAAWADAPYHMRDVVLGETTKKVKVRMFWIRHGQSCANAMDRCALDQSDFERMRPKVEAALSQHGGIYNMSKLQFAYGLQPPDGNEKDCTMAVDDLSDLARKAVFFRAHDVYRDPPLSDCARHVTKQAGRSFLSWLQSKGIKLDFIGTSNLQRTIESALAFFFEQDSKKLSSVIRGKKEVSPVPYFNEISAGRDLGLQADNRPRALKEQVRLMSKAKYSSSPINDYYAEAWPRAGQQYEKFKAFLATQIVPHLSDLRDTMPWAAAPEDPFRKKLEEDLAARIKPKNHGKTKVQFDWTGGSYETGNSFLRPEYDRLEAEEVTVAFLGHGQMMKDYCQGGEDGEMPENNAVLEKLFIVEMTPGVQRGDIQFARTVMRELAGTCGRVMGGIRLSDMTDVLVRRDVAVCQDPLDVAEWTGLQRTTISEKIFGSSDPTRCMMLADRSEAFPILPGYADEVLSV